MLGHLLSVEDGRAADAEAYFEAAMNSLKGGGGRMPARRASTACQRISPHTSTHPLSRACRAL